MSAARILGATVALVVCAWFALAIRQAIDADAAGSIVSSLTPLTPARAEHVRSLLHSAALLNPDTELDLLRSQVALRQGDGATARRLALDVAEREPMNLEAWLVLYRDSAGNARLRQIAYEHIYVLDPPVRSSH